MKITTSRRWFTLAAFALTVLFLNIVGVNALQAPPDTIVGFSISPTNPHYATVRMNGKIEITDYQTSTIIGTYFVPLPFQDVTNLDPTGYNVTAIAYSPTGIQIAIAISDISAYGRVYLLNWETGQIQESHNRSSLRRILDMSWSPDGRRLALALLDGGADQILFSSIEILNLDSGDLEQSLHEMTSIEGDSLSTVAWSSSGIIAYANDSTLVFWDTNSNTLLGTANTSDRVIDIAWARDANRIATLNADRTIQIWDINTSLSIPQQVISIVADNFRSRAMSWVGDNLLALNIWTHIEIWNVSSATLEEVIETDNFIFGLGALASNEIAFVGPQLVNTFPLTDLQTPTPTYMITATAISTMTPTATPTSTQTFTVTPTFTPTPSITPTPAVTCSVTVAVSDALGIVNAINVANANGASSDTICLTNSTYSFFSAANNIALPSISTPILIIGNGAVLERGSGAPQFRLFNVTASGSLALQNLTIRNGNASGNNGGAILNAGTLTLDGVTLTSNTARYGGAIHSSGTLMITNSTLSLNTSQENAGAIYLNNGTLTLSDSMLESNSARYGSGIYANEGTVSLTSVTFRTNTANEQGAGIFQRHGTVTISGGTFDANTARFGSAIYVRGALSVSGATFTNNVAVEEGAAIYNENGNQSAVTVAGSTFTGNRARYGGAIYNRARLNVTGSVFTSNTATESGGAVYHQNGNSQNGIAQSCFTSNTARFGGAVFSQTGNFNAQNNWWGAATGPTSAMVNSQVQFTPFLTSRCPN